MTVDALVVDDNHMIRDVIGRIVRMLLPGSSCRTCDCGREALAAIRKSDCQLAFVDLTMPDMSGIDVACAIREIEKDLGRTPMLIVAISADPAEHAWQRCQRAGFSAFLQKPFGRGEVRACLERLLPLPPAPASAPQSR